MKVFFTTIPGPHHPWEGETTIDLAKRHLAQTPPPGSRNDHVLVEQASEADAIIYFEPHYFKTRDYAEILRREENIRLWPDRCFTINGDDAPLPFLRGMYVSMPSRYFDPNRIRASCYFHGSPNPYCGGFETRRAEAPELLFSFRGAMSAPIRRRLFDTASQLTRGIPALIEESTSWYNHKEAELRSYLGDILRSKFVLCPRGQSPCSHRIFEVMQLGRVPVILADAWVPPSGPDWDGCSVRIPERALKQLPKLLQQIESQAPEMGIRARKEWDSWFSPAARLWVMLDQIQGLTAQPPADEARFQKQWDQPSFYYANLGTPSERFVRNLKDGKFWEKTRSKLQSCLKRKQES